MGGFSDFILSHFSGIQSISLLIIAEHLVSTNLIEHAHRANISDLGLPLI